MYIRLYFGSYETEENEPKKEEIEVPFLVRSRRETHTNTSNTLITRLFDNYEVFFSVKPSRPSPLLPPQL